MTKCERQLSTPGASVLSHPLRLPLCWRDDDNDAEKKKQRFPGEQTSQKAAHLSTLGFRVPAMQKSGKRKAGPAAAEDVAEKKKKRGRKQSLPSLPSCTERSLLETRPARSGSPVAAFV